MARSKFEIKAQKDLEKEGYIVDYKMRPRFPCRHYNVDYFNLFDLMAYKKGKLRMIAIKSQKTSGYDVRILREKIEKFKLPKEISKELWSYRKLKGDIEYTPNIHLLK